MASDTAVRLRELMERKGYSEGFIEAVCRYMNTDFTAGRMLGYLRHYERLPEAEVADEMIAILSERQRFIEKARSEKANAAITEWLNGPRGED